MIDYQSLKPKFNGKQVEFFQDKEDKSFWFPLAHWKAAMGNKTHRSSLHKTPYKQRRFINKYNKPLVSLIDLNRMVDIIYNGWIYGNKDFKLWFLLEILPKLDPNHPTIDKIKKKLDKEGM